MSVASPTADHADHTTISVRVLWQFARLVHNAEEDLQALGPASIDAPSFPDPDIRIPVSVYRTLLLRWRGKTGDPALGIHAAEMLEAADFAILHRVARNSANAREALFCYARYMKFIADDLTGVLLEEGERAIWHFLYDGPSPLAISNDFMVAAMWRAMHLIFAPTSLIEVHVRHGAATDAAEYNRVFGVPVRFGRSHNALVFPRASLDLPLLHANRGLFDLFDQRAQQALDRLTQGSGFDARVRVLLLKHLDEGEPHITKTARRLHISASTLRRRLAEHGTTYTELLDQLRRDLALHHLAEPRLTVSEIAFLLGFSSQSAFGRAFRRWTGVAPLTYRRGLRERASGFGDGTSE
jgi:AraC-like DNA-binding protein